MGMVQNLNLEKLQYAPESLLLEARPDAEEKAWEASMDRAEIESAERRRQARHDARAVALETARREFESATSNVQERWRSRQMACYSATFARWLSHCEAVEAEWEAYDGVMRTVRARFGHGVLCAAKRPAPPELAVPHLLQHKIVEEQERSLEYWCTHLARLRGKRRQPSVSPRRPSSANGTPTICGRGRRPSLPTAFAQQQQQQQQQQIPRAPVVDVTNQSEAVRLASPDPEAPSLHAAFAQPTCDVLASSDGQTPSMLPSGSASALVKAQRTSDATALQRPGSAVERRHSHSASRIDRKTKPHGTYTK